jgi:hypothetical protein
VPFGSTRLRMAAAHGHDAWACCHSQQPSHASKTSIRLIKKIRWSAKEKTPSERTGISNAGVRSNSLRILQALYFVGTCMGKKCTLYCVYLMRFALPTANASPSTHCPPAWPLFLPVHLRPLCRPLFRLPCRHPFHPSQPFPCSSPASCLSLACRLSPVVRPFCPFSGMFLMYMMVACKDTMLGLSYE